MEIKIEKGIPVPVDRNAKWIHLLRQMEIGDSFFIETNENAKKFDGRFSFSSKKIGIKVTVRKVYGGVRVWRIK